MGSTTINSKDGFERHPWLHIDDQVVQGYDEYHNVYPGKINY